MDEFGFISEFMTLTRTGTSLNPTQNKQRWNRSKRTENVKNSVAMLDYFRNNGVNLEEQSALQGGRPPLLRDRLGNTGMDEIPL